MTELSPDALALIRNANRGGPSPERRARMERRLAAAALAAGVGAGMSAVSTVASAKTALGTAAVSSLSGIGTSIAAWLTVGFLIGGVTVASVRALTNSTVDVAPAAERALAPRESGVARTRTQDGKREAPAAEQAAAPGAATARFAPANSKFERRPRQGQLPAGEPAVEPPAEPPRANALPDIGVETSWIETARRELATGQPERALEQLSEHERRFPSGMLSEEGLALRVVALCNLGRRDEARRIADAFLREAPRSPLVPRVRKSCAFAAVTSKEAGNR